MKTWILLFIWPFLIHLAYSQPSALGPDETARKWSIAATIGFSAFDGNYKLAKIMRKNGFDKTRQGFFGPIDYPIKKGIPAFMIESDYLLKSNQRIGISLALSDFGTTLGLNPLAGEIYVSHQDMSFQPYYALYLWSNRIQFRLGPSVHIKKLYRDYSSADKKFGGAMINTQATVKTGIYVGSSIAFFEKEKAYLRLVVACFYTPSKLAIGPFIGRSFSGEIVEIFPKEEIGNNHIVIGIRYGIKL